MAGEDDDKGAKPEKERRRGGERRQRPPVTIDLTAERVPPAKTGAPEESKAADPAVKKPEGEAAKPPPPPPPPPPSPPPPQGEAAPRASRPAGASAIGSDDGWTRMALAGAAGGLLALVVVLALQGIGVLPAPGRNAANQAAEQARAASEAVAGVDRRLASVEMLTKDLPGKNAVDALDGRVAQLQKEVGALATQGDLTALDDKLAALSKTVEALPQGVSESDLAALADRVARLETAGAGGDGGTVDSSAVTALSGRIDAAQATIKSLGERLAALEAKAGAATTTDSTLAARAIAVVALRRAAQGDQPFTTDLDLAAALGLPSDDVAALRPLAEKGVATRATLAAQFAGIGDAIIRATAQADPDAGFLKKLGTLISGLVSVRTTGPVAGDDPTAIVSRMRADVEGGDFAAALKEMDALPDAGKQAAADWAVRARDRAAVDTLTAKIARAVNPTAGNAPT